MDTAAPVLAFSLAKLSRRSRWAACVVVVLLSVGAFFAMRAYRREARAQQLSQEITVHGGYCHLESPRLWIKYWLGETVEPMPTDVSLGGSYFSSTWLETNAHLADLRIDRLGIGDSPITGDDVKAISERHPLKSLGTFHMKRADSAARGRWQAGEIEEVDFAYSDLTDKGFRDLPLEHIVILKVAGTHVTAQGLRELSRCSRLNELQLDGRQFNADVAKVLNSLPKLSGLDLDGPEVTDHHIHLLYSLPRVDGVIMYGISATQETIEEFASARPDCVMLIDGTNCHYDNLTR